MGYRNDSIAVSRDMGPLSTPRFVAWQFLGLKLWGFFVRKFGNSKRGGGISAPEKKLPPSPSQQTHPNVPSSILNEKLHPDSDSPFLGNPQIKGGFARGGFVAMIS